jgi:hypothetical protein
MVPCIVFDEEVPCVVLALALHYTDDEKILHFRSTKQKGQMQNDWVGSVSPNSLLCFWLKRFRHLVTSKLSLIHMFTGDSTVPLIIII